MNSSSESTNTSSSAPFFKVPQPGSAKFVPPSEAPPSDDEQDDFVMYDEEEEAEMMRQYEEATKQAREEEEQEQAASSDNASSRIIIPRDKLIEKRDIINTNFLHSDKGNDVIQVEFITSPRKDIFLRFDRRVEAALKALNIVEPVRSELTTARKNRDKKTVTLQRSENAWVPGAFASQVNTPEKVRSEMIDILNKMTPEKYDRLFKKFWNITGVQERDNVKVMVRCILEKALFEPNFANVYAKICRDIIDSRNYENRNQFRTTLLRETQVEFEKRHKLNEKKAQEDLEHAKNLAKRRAFGIIRFIGELFKQKILAECIIHQVLKDLLLVPKDIPSPEDIEVLCALLSSVGSVIDIPSRKIYVEIYFYVLKQLTESPKLKTRIIFMIENIIELRGDKWVPRIKEEKAQKLKQVLRNHANEEKERQHELREKRLSRHMR